MSVLTSGESVLVTGATGFIGRHLVQALRERNILVHALTRDISKIQTLWPDGSVIAVQGDLCAPGDLADSCEGKKTVFHLASASDKDGMIQGGGVHDQTTVGGTRRLIDAAVRGGVERFIFLSTTKVCGEQTATCLDERADAYPTGAYGRAKLAAEGLILDAGRERGFHACVLRLPLVYGPDNQGNIPRMIRAIDRGHFPPPPEVGNKRSMVHVRDVVQALLLAAEKPQARGKIYLVTDGSVYSVREIYALIRRALGKPVPAWSIPTWVLGAMATVGDVVGRVRGRPFVFDSSALEKLLGSAWYSSEKIARELGYRPTSTLADGIREMVAAYRAAGNRER